jgi:hypothetical protein
LLNFDRGRATVETQTAFQHLQEFHLLEHGDSREREIWPIVSNQHPGQVGYSHSPPQELRDESFDETLVKPGIVSQGRVVDEKERAIVILASLLVQAVSDSQQRGKNLNARTAIPTIRSFSLALSCTGRTRREYNCESTESLPVKGFGGRDRDRTGDPLLAKQVLSQLSYTPTVTL